MPPPNSSTEEPSVRVSPRVQKSRMPTITHLPAHIRRRAPRFELLQRADDLGFAVLPLGHIPSFADAKSYTLLRRLVGARHTFTVASSFVPSAVDSCRGNLAADTGNSLKPKDQRCASTRAYSILVTRRGRPSKLHIVWGLWPERIQSTETRPEVRFLP